MNSTTSDRQGEEDSIAVEKKKEEENRGRSLSPLRGERKKGGGWCGGRRGRTKKEEKGRHAPSPSAAQENGQTLRACAGKERGIKKSRPLSKSSSGKGEKGAFVCSSTRGCSRLVAGRRKEGPRLKGESH